MFPDDPLHPDDDAIQTLSDRTVHSLLSPLAVIKGQAQLLRRWVRRSDVADGEVLLARLEVIETMVTVLAADLHVRRRRPPPDIGEPDVPNSGLS